MDLKDKRGLVLIGLAELTGDHAEGIRLRQDGLRMAEELGLWSDVAGQLGWLASISVQVGDYPRALGYARRARRLAAGQGHRVGEVFATISLAFAARRVGRLDEAEEHLRWLLAAARDQQTEGAYPPYLSMVLVDLGLLAGQRGEVPAALAWHREALDVYQRQGRGGEWPGRWWAWRMRWCATAGRARPLGVADAAWRETELPLSVSEHGELARVRAAVEAAVPDFAAEYARGGRLTPAQARSLLDGDRA